MEKCREEILNQVDFVEKLRLPGRMIVFGEDAESILTGQNEEDTVIAAAEYGKGRIVAFSHDAYGMQVIDLENDFPNSILYKNIRSWLVRGSVKMPLRFCMLDKLNETLDVSTLKENFDVLVSLAKRESLDVSMVADYIKNGGAFIYAITPWGWAQINPNKTVNQIPYAQVLQSAGLGYSMDIATDHNGAFLPHLSKSATANLFKFTNMEKCRKEILNQVDFVKKLGHPGRMIVFGKDAESILTGKNEEDTVIAAAKYGKGRIVAFSHDAYGIQAIDLKNDFPNSKLYKNIRSWLVRGSDKTSLRFCMLDEVNKTFDVPTLKENFDVLVSLGTRESFDVSVVADYIKNGGAFIYAITPWGWAQINPNKTVDQIPYAQVLQSAGLGYSMDIATDHNGGFIPHLSKSATANLFKFTKMEKCSKEILNQVDFVEKLGLPGRMIVFGEDAESILTGQSEEDTVIAAAKFGKGRIVAFSHDTYGIQAIDLKSNFPNSTLYKNIRSWLVRGTVEESLRFCMLDELNKTFDVSTLKENFDVLVSLAKRESLDLSVVADYITNGGAFIYAITPWGWAQRNLNKTVNQIPYAQILLNAGFGYSMDIARDHNGRFLPYLSKGSSANICKCFNGTQTLDKIIDNSALLSKIVELPPKYSAQFKSDVEKFWKPAEEKLKSLCPHGKISCKDLTQRKVLDLWQFIADLQANQHFKAPCIHIFPGDYVDDSPTLSCKTVKYSSDKDAYFFPGCYVAAGSKPILEVTSLSGVWRIFIGAHTDILTNPQVNRWPKSNRKIQIQSKGTFDISSYLGGSVVFVSLGGNSSIEAKLLNVIPSPRYDSQDESSRKSWKENKNSAGLWADISGKYMTITMPSSSVRNLEDPGPVMNMYDTLLKHYHDLRGTDIEKYRKMWIVTDEQPAAGYMHAGYPIVTHMDVADPIRDDFLLNEQGMKTKTERFWGIFHEIGHNMQQGEWTFDGSLEVTVNIFTLYAMKQIGNIETWIHPWLKEHVEAGIKYINNGADFNEWKKKAGTALLIYAQLEHAFGWSIFKQVFRRYQNLPGAEKPKNNQEKMDKWFIIFSEECKFNLAPLALYWGFPITDDALNKMNALKFDNFLPTDELTEKTPARIKMISEKFPNLKRNCKK